MPIAKKIAPVVAPLLPGAAQPILYGLQLLDKSPVVTSQVNIAGVSSSPVLGSFADGVGDYFKLTHQVRLCELDADDQPIYVDPIANDDYRWQSSSTSFKYYLNAPDQPSVYDSVVNIEFSQGKFAELYASLVAANKPIIYQSRYKVEFDKTNVPIGYKAVFKYETGVGSMGVNEEDRIAMEALRPYMNQSE